VIQPLIINAGEEPFYEEFRKSNGWIVAKDVHLAFYYGGSEQKVLAMSDDPGTVTLGQKENIYLQGHGSAGKVGHYSAHTIADFIAGLKFPKGYSGKTIWART